MRVFNFSKKAGDVHRAPPAKYVMSIMRRSYRT